MDCVCWKSHVYCYVDGGDNNSTQRLSSLNAPTSEKLAAISQFSALFVSYIGPKYLTDLQI